MDILEKSSNPDDVMCHLSFLEDTLVSLRSNPEVCNLAKQEKKFAASVEKCLQRLSNCKQDLESRGTAFNAHLERVSKIVTTLTDKINTIRAQEKDQDQDLEGSLPELSLDSNDGVTSKGLPTPKEVS